MTSPVDAFRQRLDADTLAIVDALRGLIIQAHPALDEEIKWNAPSFALAGEHCITLGLERKGGVRVVLHRGASTKESMGFCFDDPDRLAKWPAADRGVLLFGTVGEVIKKHEVLDALFRRWIAATT